VDSSSHKLKILALLKAEQELVITIINPSQKRYSNLSISLEDSLPLKKVPLLKLYRFDNDHFDESEQSDYSLLQSFNLRPKSILQIVLSLDITQ